MLVAPRQPDPHAPAAELAAAIRLKRLSSRDLLETYLERIARLDGPVNSVVTVDADRARAAADQADADAGADRWHGPLHGLPVTVKDALDTAGLRSTGGAPVFADRVPSVDATAVARLRRAGAIVLGKTNLPTWSGDMQTYNELFGVTSNPWDLDSSPGGSSGGAAAAVACGFTAFETGTDIGGSIRIPAHLCGTFGLRPTYGAVPQDGYLAGPRLGRAPLDVNVVGPITRSADDLDLVFGVLSGASASSAPPARPWRVGLWLDDPFCPVESAYSGALQRLAGGLADAGVELVSTRPAVDFADSFETYWTLLGAAGGLNQPDDPLTHSVWLATHERRLAQAAAWAEWFAGADALLCPVLAVPAYPHDFTGTYATRTVAVNGVSRTHVELARWTGLVGAVGLPVAVAPAGRVADRPVGVQIVCARGADRTAIALARLVAEVGGGYEPPPNFG